MKVMNFNFQGKENQLNALMQRYQVLNRQPFLNQSQFGFLKQKLNQHLKQLERYNTLITFGQKSDQKITEIQNQLNSLIKQLQQLKKQLEGAQPNFFMRIWRSIKRLVHRIIGSIQSFFGLDRTWVQLKECDQILAQRKLQKYEKINKAKGQLKTHQGLREYFINQIKQFEKEKLPQIIQFCYDMEKIGTRGN